MALEMVYTSAARGLREGTSGFCTVAMTRGLPMTLVPRLEAIGGYRAGPNGDGPVALSFCRLETAQGVVSVLTRVAPAAPDHTNRSNKLATYLVLSSDEQCEAGPAWLLRTVRMRDAWSGAARMFDEPVHVPQGPTLEPAVCAHWQRTCGDAGWAGVLASSFLRDMGRPRTPPLVACRTRARSPVSASRKGRTTGALSPRRDGARRALHCADPARPPESLAPSGRGSTPSPQTTRNSPLPAPRTSAAPRLLPRRASSSWAPPRSGAPRRRSTSPPASPRGSRSATRRVKSLDDPKSIGLLVDIPYSLTKGQLMGAPGAMVLGVFLAPIAVGARTSGVSYSGYSHCSTVFLDPARCGCRARVGGIGTWYLDWQDRNRASCHLRRREKPCSSHGSRW